MFLNNYVTELYRHWEVDAIRMIFRHPIATTVFSKGILGFSRGGGINSREQLTASIHNTYRDPYASC